MTSLLLLLTMVLPAAAEELTSEVIFRVADTMGQPVSGATLEVYELNRGLVTLSKTGLDGLLRIPYQGGKRNLWLARASAPAYQVRETGWFDPAQGGVKMISLEPVGGSLQLFLRAASGERLNADVTVLAKNGRLVLQAKAEDGRLPQTELPAGEYRLIAAAEGYTPVERTLSVAPGRVTAETVILASRTLQVEGEVVDGTTEAPIRGAQVELLGKNGVLLAEGVTEANGRFRLSAQNSSQEYKVRVSAPGYASTVTEPRKADPSGNLDFLGQDRVRLGQPTAAIEGVLIGFGSTPLKDTQVVLLRKGLGEVAATTTDKDGRFRFERLPAGGIGYKVVADKVSGGDWDDLVVSDWVEPKQGATHWVSVTAQSFPHIGSAAATLSGLVLSHTGLPVEGATVELIRYTRVERTTTTDSFGRFTFDNVSASEREGMTSAPYTVRISRNGYVTTRQVLVAGQDRTEFQVPEEGRLTVTATLRPDATVPKGRVVDQYGRPVADARVALTVAGKDAPIVARTDTNGWYLLGRVPSHAAKASLRVTAPGFLPSDEVDLTPVLSSGNAPPTVQLTARNITFDGLVVDLQGKPVSGAKVKLWHDGTVAAETVADRDGYYSVSADLTTAALSLLTAEQAGFGGGSLVVSQLPSPGEQVSQPLIIQQEQAVVEGRVLDGAGKPVAGITVELVTEGSEESVVATSDHEGRYRIVRSLPSGSTWVWLRANPLLGKFGGSLSHGMDLSPLTRLSPGERLVIDLLVQP